MYKDDQPRIAAFAQSSAENMHRTLTFVLCTIQQQLSVVPECMADIDRHGSESRFLWGFKGPAYEALCENINALYGAAMATSRVYASPNTRRDELLNLFASLSGFGLVKGGFAVQLIFGQSGCIDSHNLAMYGVQPGRVRAGRFKRAKPKTRSLIVSEYHNICDDIGGTAFLWDNWCEHLAKRTPAPFHTADEVSNFHVHAILGD